MSLRPTIQFYVSEASSIQIIHDNLICTHGFEPEQYFSFTSIKIRQQQAYFFERSSTAWIWSQDWPATSDF